MTTTRTPRTAADRYGWTDTVLDDDTVDALDRMAGAAWHRAENRGAGLLPARRHRADRWDGDEAEIHAFLTAHPAF